MTLLKCCSVLITTEKDNVVTVYSVPSNAPSIYEGVVFEDSFQIVVKSSDFDKATELMTFKKRCINYKMWLCKFN